MGERRVPTNVKVEKYGKVYKTLHWLLALNIGLTMIFSFGMSDLLDSEKVAEFPRHAVSVTTIFILMVIRLLWRLMNPPPPPPMEDNWQRKAAGLAHCTLYVLIFFQIGLGMMLASTTAVEFHTPEYGINYTAWNLVSDSWHPQLLLAHKICYALLVTLVIVHSLAALKHQFIDRDAVLRRMLPFGRVD